MQNPLSHITKFNNSRKTNSIENLYLFLNLTRMNDLIFVPRDQAI